LVIRGIALGFLLLLAACSSRGANGVGSGPPGIEVADAALHGGSPEIALQIASGLVAKYPGNEAALLTQGEALTALGRADEAAASFEEALKTNPTSVGAQIGLGRLRLATDPAAAEALFLQALAHEPRNDVAMNDLGIARDLQGRHTDAQTAYRQALGVSPDMTAAQVNLALSLAMSGQSKDAVQLLRPLADAPKATPQLRHDLAAVLTMGGDKEGAERILSRDLSPNEVQQAVDAYAGEGKGAAANLLTAEPKTPGVPATVPLHATITQAAAPAAAAVQVQLAGATETRDAAEAKWEGLTKVMPDLLGERKPILTEVTQAGQMAWRVRTGGFADADAASAFCERIRAHGTICVPVQ
jgi:Flp pilus assembly protein TadD